MRRNDDDDAAGAQPVRDGRASTTRAATKGMARISSVLHTIPESQPSSQSGRAMTKQRSTSSKSGTALIVVNQSDLRQGRLLSFHSRIIEWHYHVQQSMQAMPYDLILLSMLVLFVVSTLGDSSAAAVLSAVLVGAVWGLAAWPSLMVHVRDEVLLLLALRQLTCMAQVGLVVASAPIHFDGRRGALMCNWRCRLA